MDLSFERWAAATPDERIDVARHLARQLPTGFAFDGVRRHRLGDQEHQVAHFRHGASSFSLIPGGPVTIGYDADRPWQPTSDELENWQDDRRYWFDEGKTIQECLADVTLRPRRVELGPILIETVPEEFGREVIGLDDPIVQRLIPRAHFNARDGDTQVIQTKDGSYLAERFRRWTHADLAARLAFEGFRFPTSDEWEYVCGAGASTLYRWGDHAPSCDWPDLPTDDCEDPPGGFPYDYWDLLREPNAFGLVIACVTGDNELVAESGLTRGGDGGYADHGGSGPFVAWLRLATSYFEAEYCTYDPTKLIPSGFDRGRRVLDLS